MAKEYLLQRESRINAPLSRVFDFFAAAENLGRITPPELNFSIETALPVTMKPGTIIDYTIRLFGVPMKWRTLISVWEAPHRFVDEQIRGPYRTWIHTHTFIGDGEETIVRDEVRYSLPFGILGRMAHPLVARQLQRIFDHREKMVSSFEF